jgi:hypothetical protein
VVDQHRTYLAHTKTLPGRLSQTARGTSTADPKPDSVDRAKPIREAEGSARPCRDALSVVPRSVRTHANPSNWRLE